MLGIRDRIRRFHPELDWSNQNLQDQRRLTKTWSNRVCLSSSREIKLSETESESESIRLVLCVKNLSLSLKPSLSLSLSLREFLRDLQAFQARHLLGILRCGAYSDLFRSIFSK
jgi:hypothetical protein